MKKKRPLILISNDDSYEAPGLYHLIDCISHLGDIVAVAPAEPHSGQSSAITVNNPLRMTLVRNYKGTPVYAVTGTPVDCVKLAFHVLFKGRQPDLMLSGINHGSNSGVSVIYSGTMGAAMEACINGIPAIGYSLLSHSMDADFSETTRFIVAITEAILGNGLPEGICLNVNFPAKCKILGSKVTRAARGRWTEEYADYTDPHGRPFYYLTGHFDNAEPDNAETDEYWLERGYATIVPVRPDQSASDVIEPLSALATD